MVTVLCTVLGATAVGLFLGASSSQASVCVTGTQPGFTVTSGDVCVENAKIIGGITVTNGASLEVYDSTIKGSISATAPGDIVVCDTKLASISVTAATGEVEIGNPSALLLGCGGNFIQGGLTVANNTGGATVECNRIGGSWLVINNTPYNIDLGNHHKGNGPSFCRGNIG